MASEAVYVSILFAEHVVRIFALQSPKRALAIIISS